MSGKQGIIIHDQKQKKFLLIITGQIETAEFISITNTYCKYCFVYGPDWKQVGGLEKGITPIGHKNNRTQGNRITLGTPIEANFTSTNPFKWPRIVLSFFGQDLFGNEVIRGYATTHVPTVPGRIKRKCPIFLPQATTAMQQMLGLFTGRREEFVDPRTVAMAEGRDVTRVTTLGFVDISFSIILRDTKKFGYDLCPQTAIKFSEFPLDWPSTRKVNNDGVTSSKDIQRIDEQKEVTIPKKADTET